MIKILRKAAFFSVIALFFALQATISSADSSDIFAKNEYTHVLHDLQYNHYLSQNTLQMYKNFMTNKTIYVGGAPAVRFEYKVFGKATKDKPYPLYISLHGGGKTTKEKNDQQWKNQINLYDIPFGIYIAPRAPWDDWNMWFQEPIDRVIEEFIKVFYYSDYKIDKERVYLLGYSAGGDGVWRLATRMPDAFAAASMMAGHPGDVSLKNLYNLPFMIWIGENDSAYNRNRECAQRIAELSLLRKQSNNEGYEFSGQIVKGKGHWMDREDRKAIPWMNRHVRNPYPKHVVWHQEEVVRNHMYQLEIDAKNAKQGDEAIVDFNYSKNSIQVLKSDYQTLYININDSMFDMDKNIKVYNASGKLVFDDVVQRSKSQLLHSLHVYGGIYGAYPGQIAVTKAMLN